MAATPTPKTAASTAAPSADAASTETETPSSAAAAAERSPDPRRIAFVAAEVAGFAKTGGLADVAAALPTHLHRRGHDVRVFMPFHGVIDRTKHRIVPVDFLQDLRISLGGRRYRARVFVTEVSTDGPSIYLIDCPSLFHRDGVYTGGEDDALRFALLAQTVFLCCQHMGWAPDILHGNDWHTALLPIYLRTLFGWDRLFARTKTVLTIHNMAYQGVFPASIVGAIGLGGVRDLLHQEDLQGRGVINFMRTGLLYADAVTAVSETYAREIQTAEHGHGLEGTVRARAGTVVGIVNGVDYGTWDPRHDPHLPRRYGLDDVGEGKFANKHALLSELAMPVDDLRGDDRSPPLLGIVSRMTAQKGFDLLFDVLPPLLRHTRTRLVALGSGADRYAGFFASLQRSFPSRVCYYNGYSELMAHRIEAAADIFLMPSRFEPCGLNQLYSLRYGTPPLVRRTGGLADTVRHFVRGSAAGETRGTGFVFDHFDPKGFAWALGQALALYPDRPRWHRLRRNAMQQDYSWTRQGAIYERLYATVLGG
ncbi:MAG: glycogen synthase [Acidobacteriota bacterium]